jgi:hypothetical protein
MNTEQLKALVSDRGTLMAGIDEISQIAENDYGISRTTLIKIHDATIRIMNELKYDATIKVSEPTDR